MIRFLVALVLLCTTPVQATLRAEESDQNLPGGPIQKFFTATTTVDGIPVYREEWRVWTGRGWVPLMSEEGQAEAFGVRPSPVPHPILPPPPIPKHQRRME